MEIVDIVNEKDEIIGKMDKIESHKKGLLHRTVIAEVINSKGQWLLVQQTPHKQEPGKYVSPMGGHVQSGESKELALKRELEEELNIKHFTFKLKGKFIYNVPILKHIENHYFIVYEVYTDDTIVLSDESCNARWFTKKELQDEVKNYPEKFGKSFYAVFNHLYKDLFCVDAV
ncbi:MAG: NUDIX domain-containing protein [bacterium]|nr:NUDIX domain-containing protein [bacterium]